MHTRFSATLLPLFACGFASIAVAQEYCVVCFEPDARYRCIVAADPGAAPSASRSQFLCITELARTGQHASCAVGRMSPETCGGDLKTVMVPSTSDTLLPPDKEWQPEVVERSSEPPTEHAQQNPEAPSQAPPQTVEELAKQTVDASGKGLKKAGKAVSDTAQSAGQVVSDTWKCLSSFFSDC